MSALMDANSTATTHQLIATALNHWTSPLVRLDALAQLQAEFDRLTQREVARARNLGEPKSWSEIGAALGMTKQAAQQRYGKKKPTTATSPMDVPLPIGED